MNDRQRYLRTGEAAKEIGVSRKTIKRWIKQGKIKYIKNPVGWHLIPIDEIERLKNERNDTLANDIINLLKKLNVSYLKHIQMILENKYTHERIRAKLNFLESIGILRSKYVGIKIKREIRKYRWYYLSNEDPKLVRRLINERKMLFKYVDEFTREYKCNNVKYADYSEYLVEQAMIRAGYTVVSKDTYYFNGFAYRVNSGTGRPRDLDFIAKLPGRDIYIGVEIKNRKEPPKKSDIDSLVDITRFLKVYPVLVCRWAHPLTFDIINNLGGYVIVFKNILFKPGFERDILDRLRSINFPVAVYKWPPDFLIRKFSEAAKVIGRK